MSELVKIEPEYVYVTIPAEYICVYHRILAMMADYGEDMLKDCKASCTDKNSGVIECFNMFNAAVAARKLGKDKLAETLIVYIKAKINQIYKGVDNSTSFVFPVDETGRLKAFVSCADLPTFEINPDDMKLYEHKYGRGFDEHFQLGEEDESPDGTDPEPAPVEKGLNLEFAPSYEQDSADTSKYHPCGELVVKYDGEVITGGYLENRYFDEAEITNWGDVELTSEDVGEHNFKVVILYHNETKIINANKLFTTI